MRGRVGQLSAIVAAARAAAQGRLAACLARQRQLRERAAGLARTARSAPPGGDAADMVLTASWQGRLHEAAAAALAEAGGMEEETARLRSGLALALGREQAVEALEKAGRAARRRLAERRADDGVPSAGRAPTLRPPEPVQPPSTRPGAG